MRVLPKPEMPEGDYIPPYGLGDSIEAVHVTGSRLYGAARINGVVFWYYPPTDQLIRADKWLDIVGDPDAPEPASESFVD